MITQTYWFVVCLMTSLENIDRFGAVVVDLNGSVEYFTHGLHFDVIAVNVVTPLAGDVCLEVFGHVLGKIIGIFGLKSQKLKKGFEKNN